ncbi:MAG: hypothetical protein J6Z80_00405 [Clostridia bacterium]|nr:hypothetical protein [Clostridia bacterium]
MKKITALILLLGMLAGTVALSSCVSGKGPSVGTKPQLTPADDDRDLSRFSSIDLDGMTVNILSRAYPRHENELTVDADSEPKDFILASVYQRQIRTEAALKVKIVNTRVEPDNEHGGQNVIPSIVASMDPAFDIYASSFYATSTLATQGTFKNLFDVPTIDLDREYWSDYFNGKAQIGNRLYLTTGDLATSALRFLFVTFFNKELVDEYKIKDPYEMVDDGTWTYNTMYEIVKDIYVDLNSDQTVDEADFYGLGLNNYLGVDAYTSAFNMPTISINKDGDAEIVVNVNKYADVVNKLYTLFWQTQGVLNRQDPDGIADVFAQNRLIFAQSWLYNCEKIVMRDMENDYGIIPYPKYNENQKNYYSFGHDQITVVCIPKSSQKAEEAGYVLEVMGALSRSTTIDQYYENALKGRYARDEKSHDMLDMIRKNFLLDTGWIYCESTELMSRMLRTMIEGKSKNFMSFYQTYSGSFEDSVDRLNETFALLD